ncbi:MAG: MobA/MobL family protein [Pseudomonadota bacterium]|nr:MobA/MobL family protein [Pseudomonadota bacterium]
MAIYHLTANIISRARGQRVVAAAAYRAGAALRDERYGVTHNYAARRDTLHAEIMAPEGSPAWVQDREMLWNSVEAREVRKDSQLARVIEVGLPMELSADEHIALVRDYIAQQFVAKGMIADFVIRRNTNNPHAHILLTLRALTQSGFGPKERRWNGKAALLEWRSAWAGRVNEHLARAGHAVSIDHRTLEAQQIELTPGRRVGGRARQSDAVPDYIGERIAEQQLIARQNGRTILEDPTVALRAITHQRPTFTMQELTQFLRSRTESAAQLDAALLAISRSADLVALDGAGGQERFTSRDMIEAHQSLVRRAASMLLRRGHAVDTDRRLAVLGQSTLTDAERCSFDYVVSDGDLKALTTGAAAKAVLLPAARHAWHAQGLTVEGAAPSAAEARHLEAATGIGSQDLAQCEERWHRGLGRLTRDTVFVLDGAQLLGLKQLERALAAADNARAKIVLMADSDQLRAMKAEPPFCTLLRQVPAPAGAKSGA